MKNIFHIICIGILISCNNSTTEKSKVDIIEPEIIDTVYSSDRLKSFAVKKDRFNGIREETNGKLIDDIIWKEKRNTYMTLLSEEYVYKKEFGGIYVNHWKWGQERPEKQWTYIDTLGCGEADVVVSSDLDSLIIEDIDNDSFNEIIIVYTLSCTYDVSPQRRMLVILDQKGNEKLKLKGWTLDPGNFGNITEIDLKFNSETDDYSPNSPQGKIENYDALDNWSKLSKDRLLEIWRSVFKKDLNNS